MLQNHLVMASSSWSPRSIPISGNRWLNSDLSITASPLDVAGSLIEPAFFIFASEICLSLVDLLDFNESLGNPK
jgi:hypothetical protein